MVESRQGPAFVSRAAACLVIVEVIVEIVVVVVVLVVVVAENHTDRTTNKLSKIKTNLI
jgi:hypothetical protein